VVSTAKSRLVVGVISSARSSNSRASVSSVVRWADIVSRGSKTTSSNRRSGDFRVAETATALLALPELDAGALGVAVGGAWAVALLLLVVLVDEELERDGDEEEEGSENGDSEACGVEPADGSKSSRVGPLVLGVVTTAAEAVLGVLVSITERRLDVAGTNEAPSRVKTAIAIIPPQQRTLKIMARRAKMVFPPRQHVNKTAKMV